MPSDTGQVNVVGRRFVALSVIYVPRLFGNCQMLNVVPNLTDVAERSRLYCTLTVVTCLSSDRSGVNRTPSRRTLYRGLVLPIMRKYSFLFK